MGSFHEQPGRRAAVRPAATPAADRRTTARSRVSPNATRMPVPDRVLAAVRVLAAAAILGSLPAAAAPTDRSMIVLGIDGMDPEILTELMDLGKMPNFVRLRDAGGYQPLGTAVPPQSPVAWSNFITGMDSGGHGIFDFIHREPATMLPYLSTARVDAGSGRSVRLGRYVFPLSAPTTLLLRDGRAFWEILQEHGIPATVFKIPANYPPADFEGRSLSGMGTPDILGTPGTFSYFTDDPAWPAQELDGGEVYEVEVRDHTVETALHGPRNTFIRVKEGEEQPAALAPFSVRIDPDHDVVRIELEDQEAVLAVGEWSDWMVAEFELVPHLATVSGICRFYLKQLHPHLGLYVTPVNLNPADPAQPISTPSDYAAELCEELGFFYTQGMPEDTKALTKGVFDDADFVKQSGLVLAERERLLDHVLGDWDGRGLLFFYFSSVDQQCHMLWHHTDPQHPVYDQTIAGEYAQALTDTYTAMDRALGKVLDRIDDRTTLIVMSDHGFAPFRRAVHLNRWLADEGYLVLKQPLPPTGDQAPSIFLHIDWLRTRAYAFGLNLLYVNVQGRERRGAVPPRDRRPLVDEIAAKLLELRDPERGDRMVTRVYPREDVYHGPHVADGPDLVVGYAAGYRASWQTALGQIPAELVTDNLEKWSGDHCMDHTAVPGILLANRPITHPDPELTDLTATILDEFGIQRSEMMRGRSIFQDQRAAR